MSYKTYENYKVSKTNFFGLIPDNWDEIRIKFFANIFGRIGFRGYTASDLVEEGEGAITLGPPNIENQKLMLDNKKYLSWEKYEESPEIQIFNGDLLLVKTASVGKVALVKDLNEPTTINPQLVVFKNIKVNKEYFYYAMISDSIQQQISSNLKGGVISTLTQEEIQNYIIPIPNEQEQKEIVNYLNAKTSQIENNISKNKELIALLEEKKTALINHAVTKGLDPNVSMKDTGIEWIGTIPEHWEVRKIKEISLVKPSNIDKKSKENEPPVLLCNYTDVYNNEFITNDLDFMRATSSHEQIRKLTLKKEDIIITKDSETAEDIGVPAIVTEDLDNVVCGYHLTVIKPNDSIYNKFLFRCFESKKVNDQFVIAANGITRFGLSLYPIANSYVCIPPFEEQKEISIFLEKEISKIYKIINKIEKEIILLEEYKASLIHHVVTGKIDVRNEN